MSWQLAHRHSTQMTWWPSIAASCETGFPTYRTIPWTCLSEAFCKKTPGKDWPTLRESKPTIILKISTGKWWQRRRFSLLYVGGKLPAARRRRYSESEDMMASLVLWSQEMAIVGALLPTIKQKTTFF